MIAGVDFYREFGDRLRNARQRRELTQQELAMRVGLSRAVIANIESGRQRVALEALPLFARAVGLAPEDLLPQIPQWPSPADLATGLRDSDRELVARVWERGVARRRRQLHSATS